jgi:hypothetical protein
LEEIMDKPFQVRDEEGGLEYFDTLKEALEKAKKNRSIWKISFSLPSEERVRLVRISGDRFLLQQMDEFLDKQEDILRNAIDYLS